MILTRSFLFGLGAALVACGGDDDSGSGGKSRSDAGTDATAGTGGGAGVGGAAGTGGGGGAGGSGGSVGGSAGTGGGAGASGAAGAAGADGGGIGSPPNVAFVTNESFVVSTLGGLAGADAKCQAAAAAAGLPGTFVAWLSDSSADALTRLGTARAWARTDGRPFVDSVADLVALRHLYPLHIDENGQRIVATVVTGTGPDGLRQSATGDFCQDWTGENAAVGFVGGDPDSFGPNWTGASTNPLFTTPCTNEANLYCFQTDHSDPLVTNFPTSRKVFVTLATVPLGGLAALDQHCTDQAAAGGVFTGSFKALVATDGASAISRFDDTGAPWGRRDGVLLTDSAADIATATQLLAPINEFSDGTFVWDTPGGDLVYSGAATPGTPGIAAETCGGDWSSTSGQHRFGFAGLSTKEWWDDQRLPSPAACNTFRRVYCFEE